MLYLVIGSVVLVVELLCQTIPIVKVLKTYDSLPRL